MSNPSSHAESPPARHALAVLVAAGAALIAIALMAAPVRVGLAAEPPAAASLAAVTPPVGPTRSPSPVIYPPQDVPLMFSHAAHASEFPNMTCDRCHPSAATSKSSVDNLMAREAACTGDGCHTIDRAAPSAAACARCHPGFRDGDRTVARVRVPAPNLKFAHQSHVGRGAACATCHGDFAAVGLGGREQLPRMATCLGCHDGSRASAACTTCHLTGEAGRITTHFADGDLVPSGSLRGDAHDLTFVRRHADLAQADARYCASCHQEEFCSDCHDGAVKPLDYHTGDYLSIHPIEARRNVPDCSTCHRSQTFCVGCHSRVGLSADGRVGAPEADDPEAGRFHPAGWAEETIGADHHALEARRNLKQCASCHREQFCVGCHTAEEGSMQVSPHPVGWAGSRRCEALAARNERMCLRCHITPEERGCDWRAGGP